MLLFGGAEQNLDGIHCLPNVAPAGRRNMLPDAGLADHLGLSPLLHDGQPPVNGGQGVLGRDLLEFEHAGAGQHRAEHRKEGVLRGGGDEGDAAVLHELQQGLLLLFVEILDLVQIQQHPLRSQQGADVRHNVLNVREG